MNIIEHGAAGIGLIRHMHGALRQAPDQPGVNGAEEELSPLRPFSGPRHIVQQPLNLGAGEVGVRHKAGLLPDLVGKALRHQIVDNVRRAAALPDYGVGDGVPCVLVPYNRCLALVGDADGRDVRRRHAQLPHSRA